MRTNLPIAYAAGSTGAKPASVAREASSCKGRSAGISTRFGGADEIATQLGKERSSVLEALRGTPRPPPSVLGAGSSLIEPHATRTPRAILHQDMVRSTAADFAAGKIDRDELLRQITR